MSKLDLYIRIKIHLIDNGMSEIDNVHHNKHSILIRKEIKMEKIKKNEQLFMGFV